MSEKVEQIGIKLIDLPLEIKKTDAKVFGATDYIFNRVKRFFLATFKKVVYQTSDQVKKAEEKLGIKIETLDSEIKMADVDKVKLIKVPAAYFSNLTKLIYGRIARQESKPVEIDAKEPNIELRNLDEVLNNLNATTEKVVPFKDVASGVTIISQGDNNYLFDSNGKELPNPDYDTINYFKTLRDNSLNPVQLTSNKIEEKVVAVEPEVKVEEKVVAVEPEVKAEEKIENVEVNRPSDLEELVSSIGNKQYEKRIYEDGTIAINNDKEYHLFDASGKEYGYDVERSVYYDRKVPVSVDKYNEIKEVTEPLVQTTSVDSALFEQIMAEKKVLELKLAASEERNKWLMEQVSSRIDAIDGKIANVMVNTKSIDDKTTIVKDALGTVLKSIGAQLQMGSDLKQQLNNAQSVVDASAIQYTKE